jgi:OFA family oxalate/formate antiporter-like MFS transporter
MLRTRQFWLLYAMFVAMSAAGLMLTAKVVQFATHYDLAGVRLGGATLNTVTVSAMLLPLAGGVGRLVVGDLSDRMARHHAMAASFLACGLGLFAVVAAGATGASVAFVVAVVAATFFWSPQYTLFPSVVGDYYGSKHSSANYALLYSGKIWGGVFGGTVAGALVTFVGWTSTFLIGGTLAVLAGLTALVDSRTVTGFRARSPAGLRRRVCRLSHRRAVRDSHSQTSPRRGRRPYQR